MTFLPVEPDIGNLCHCLYIMEINFEPQAGRLSNISGDMASAVLETCIKLRGATDFTKTMADVIKDIRDLCGAEHCCVLTMNPSERTCEVLCESFAEGSKLLPMERYIDENFYSIAESWEGTIAGSNCLIVKNEQDMDVVRERNPVWHESLKSAGANRIVLFPLKSRGQLLGYIWALNFNAGNAVKIKETLELTTFILGSELGSHLLLDRLKILSSKDMLTGVLNRNEMNILVDKLSKDESLDGQSVGVVFADLNGLKTMNDQQGHVAGALAVRRRLLEAVFKRDVLALVHDLIADVHHHVAFARRHGIITMFQFRSQTSESHNAASHSSSEMTFSDACSFIKASICSTVCIASEQLWLATTIAACAVPCWSACGTVQPASRP